MIKQGQTVTIKPDWRDAGDQHIQFIALQDEDGGRVLICALDVLQCFTPSQVVTVDMLEA